jgi:hypothetical protein
MDYYHDHSDGMFFVPAFLFLMIVACAAAAWFASNSSSNCPNIPQVIKHVIVLPNPSGMA